MPGLTLSDIRTQVLDLLLETSSNTHFTTTQLNSFVNQAIKLMCPIIELPRKEGTAITVTAGMGDITLPTDNIIILDVYMGDKTTGDISPLQVTTEQTLKTIYPRWLSTLAGDRGTPRFFIKKTETTGVLIPRADSASAGKNIYFNYVYEPTDLSSDSDSPALPLPYHQIIKFYVLSLCYRSLSRPELAEQAKKDFIDHHKAIQSGATKETREGKTWAWGDNDVNADEGSTIVFT